MTDKELKKLSRTELLEMLLASTKENRDLRSRLDAQGQQLEDKELSVSEAGSIAEAALKVNGVFTAAEAAAAQYLDNIKNQEQVCQNMQREAEEKAAKIIADAEKEAEETKAMAKRAADAYWNDVSKRLERFYAEHKGLRELLSFDKGRMQ